jgi:hypothetical protein
MTLELGCQLKAQALVDLYIRNSLAGLKITWHALGVCLIGNNLDQSLSDALAPIFRGDCHEVEKVIASRVLPNS